MPNTHQEHPEDMLLTGEVWPIDAMFDTAHVSLKIDGAPSIVWGTHPETKQFFVGTKSVFNKQRIKINYTYSDICRNHPQDDLRRILSGCLSFLPRTEGVYQGDFIGFGGKKEYTPNTLTYKFDKMVMANIIVAPHTEYHIPGKMCNAQPQPIMEEFTNTPHVKWIQPMVDRVMLTDAWHVDKDQVEFLRPGQAAKVKIAINAAIREGKQLTVPLLTSIIGDHQLAHMYKLVMLLKQEYLKSLIVYGAPKTYLRDQRVFGEGVTVCTDEGMFKVVNRAEFAHANFTTGRFQQNK